MVAGLGRRPDPGNITNQLIYYDKDICFTETKHLNLKFNFEIQASRIAISFAEEIWLMLEFWKLFGIFQHLTGVLLTPNSVAASDPYDCVQSKINLLY